MGWSNKDKAHGRDYKAEYKYQGTAEQKKKRAMRNAARAEAIANGTAKKGDGKDVHHVKPISKGGTNKTGTRAVPKSKNRSFARTSSGAMKTRRKYG